MRHRYLRRITSRVTLRPISNPTHLTVSHPILQFRTNTARFGVQSSPDSSPQIKPRAYSTSADAERLREYTDQLAAVSRTRSPTAKDDFKNILQSSIQDNIVLDMHYINYATSALRNFPEFIPLFDTLVQNNTSHRILSPQDYAVILRCYISQNSTVRALRLVELLITLRAPLNTPLLVMMAIVHLRSGNLNDFKTVYSSLVKKRLECKDATRLITELKNNEHYDMIEQVYRDSVGGESDLTYFTAAIRAFSQMRRMDLMDDCLNRMINKFGVNGIDPTTKGFLKGSYRAIGQTHHLDSLLPSQPTSFTFDYMDDGPSLQRLYSRILTCGELELFDELNFLYEQVTKQKMLSALTLSAFITAYTFAPEPEAKVRELVSILYSMPQAAKISTVQALTKFYSLRFLLNELLALEEYVKKHNLRSLQVYNHFILAYGKLKSDAGLVQVERLLKEAEESGLLPDKFIYSTILTIYSEHLLTEKVKYYLAQMKENSYMLDVPCYNTMLTATSRFCGAAEFKELVEFMKEQGIVFDDRTYAALLKHYVKEQDADAITRVVAEVTASTNRITKLWNNMILSLIQVHKVQEAKLLNEEMKAIGIRENSYTRDIRSHLNSRLAGSKVGAPPES